MKNLSQLLIAAILLSTSCGKREAAWDELTGADRAAITTRAYNECKAETDSDFERFQNSSETVYASSKWERGDGWLHILKNTTNNNSEDRKHDIRIWKNDGDTLYLYVTRTINSLTRVYFIRIPKTTNETMIEMLNEQYCNRQVAMGFASSHLSAEEEYETSGGTNTYQYTDVYKFTYEYPALAGTEWNITSRTVKTVDSDDDVIKTEKFASTFTAQSNVTFTSNDHATYNAEYCDITLPAADSVGVTYKVPYVIPESCTKNFADVSGTWNLTI